ncbi:MAG: hydroxymethylbilane synthase [Nitrososphaerota archaeon]|nr:hydroxymethylbilane synthase [Nitrososphaerota archaeon]
MTSRKLRIGTRGSPLALAQTAIVKGLLEGASQGVEFEVVPVRTRGDAVPPERRGESDGKGVFTKDIEAMLLEGSLDLAVHSMKDLSVDLDGGLTIAAAPPRGDPRDALVSAGDRRLGALPTGATIGTSSVRRKAQLLNMRRDLRLVDLHGNVETRVRKMTELGIHGVVLAAAGLDRLSIGTKAAERFPTDQLVPAAGQGALAVETLRKNDEVIRLVSKISDAKTMAATECEREFARAVGADCDVPVGAFAAYNGRSVTLTGVIASPDGTDVIRRGATSTEMAGLGARLGKEMLELGGSKLLAGGARRV